MTVRVLYGKDHTTLDQVAIVSTGRAAAALSPGRYPKGYPHTDPNEDCVAIADLGTHLLLAVADGHSGAEAAEAAISGIAAGTQYLDLADPASALRKLIATVTGLVAGHDGLSRTALTVVLFDSTRAHCLTFGDTTAVLLRGDKAKRINRPSSFLGTGSTIAHARFDRVSLRPGDRLVAATDGLIDFLGRNALRHLAAIPEPKPQAWVASAVDMALAGGAGDNIGVAFAGL